MSNSVFRFLFFSLSAGIWIAFFYFVINPAWAQDQNEIPEYVIERFGNPPTIPTGPLSEDLEQAVDMAFVESVKRLRLGA